MQLRLVTLIVSTAWVLSSISCSKSTESEFERSGGSGTVGGNPEFELRILARDNCQKNEVKRLSFCASKISFVVEGAILNCFPETKDGEEFQYLDIDMSQGANIPLECSENFIKSIDRVLNTREVNIAQSEQCEEGGDIRVENCGGEIYTIENDLLTSGEQHWISFEPAEEFWTQTGNRNLFSVENLTIEQQFK